MEKLLKYLNQYELERVITGKAKKALFWSENYARRKYEKFIVKKYGFIEWLIDNDKIDKSLWNAGVELYHTSYTMYEAILMLLSISDSPVIDLIYYLK